MGDFKTTVVCNGRVLQPGEKIIPPKAVQDLILSMAMQGLDEHRRQLAAKDKEAIAV